MKFFIKIFKFFQSQTTLSTANNSSKDFFELSNSSLLVISERITELPLDKVSEGKQIYNETLKAYEICYDIEKVLWAFKQCISAHHKMAMERLNSLASSEYWMMRKSILEKLGERISKLPVEKRDEGAEIYAVCEEGIDICYRTVKQLENFKLCSLSHYKVATDKLSEMFKNTGCTLKLSTTIISFTFGCFLLQHFLLSKN